MAWVQLLVAGVLEIGWAIGLKYSDGFTQRTASVLTICGMVASFYLLAQAARVLPIGTAYAVWTGIGAAGAAILGMLVLGETVSLFRILCICLILLGILGLKLSHA